MNVVLQQLCEKWANTSKLSVVKHRRQLDACNRATTLPGTQCIKTGSFHVTSVDNEKYASLDIGSKTLLQSAAAYKES